MTRVALHPRLLFRTLVALVTALSLLAPQVYSAGCHCAACCTQQQPLNASPVEEAPACCCCKPHAPAQSASTLQARCDCAQADLQWSNYLESNKTETSGKTSVCPVDLCADYSLGYTDAALTSEREIHAVPVATPFATHATLCKRLE